MQLYNMRNGNSLMKQLKDDIKMCTTKVQTISRIITVNQKQ